MKLLTQLFLFFLTLNSCIIHIVNDNALDTIDQDIMKKIEILSSFETTDTSHIYEITGTQLMEELNKHEGSLVYIFANNCSSENCVPLNVIEKYGHENNLKVFLVMMSYYHVEESLVQKLENQLFSINAEEYGISKSRKYIEAFKKDLGYYDYPTDEKYPGNYIFFKGDSITSIKHNLNDR